jgi:hypothetical protein
MIGLKTEKLLFEARGMAYQMGGTLTGTDKACRDEIHWYEAHGIDKVKHKIKRF